MEHLIKRLTDSVAVAEKQGENMDDVSCGMQEGILISYNEAKAVVEALKEANLISSNIVLADSLPIEKCNICGSKKVELIHRCKCGVEW
jgi:hypothetical protein